MMRPREGSSSRFFLHKMETLSCINVSVDNVVFRVNQHFKRTAVGISRPRTGCCESELTGVSTMGTALPCFRGIALEISRPRVLVVGVSVRINACARGGSSIGIALLCMFSLPQAPRDLWVVNDTNRRPATDLL